MIQAPDMNIMSKTKRTYILAMLCTILCTALTWAQQSELTHNLKVELKSGEVVSYNTEQIEKVSFAEVVEDGELFITVDEIGKTYFKFSINAGEQRYIFAVVETGEIDFYGNENVNGESYLLAMLGHIASGSAQYNWEDGTTFEIEDIRVKPGRNYTILAAIWKSDGNEPDHIYRKDLTTEAEPQSQSNVDIDVLNITADSAKVHVVPAENVVSYIVYVRDKAWADNIIQQYGEVVLQSTVERACELGQAFPYDEESESTWPNLLPDTDYSCMVVLTDSDGNKKLQKENFRTFKKEQPTDTK